MALRRRILAYRILSMDQACGDAMNKVYARKYYPPSALTDRMFVK